MFKLYCDLCDTEITPAHKFPIARITIEEEDYIGNLEFMSDEDCTTHKAYLCSGCAVKLYKFMKIYY